VPDVFDLGQMFAHEQEVLYAELRTTVGMNVHAGTAGDHAELQWRKLLSGLLPARYRVGNGFVVDSEGTRSDQIDCIVFDRHYSPLIWRLDDALHVPAESVYAVFEIRPDISKENIEYASAKISSVRERYRTSAEIHHAGGVYEPVPLKTIIGGILARESSWTPPFGDPFLAALKAARDIGELDLGCAAGSGSFAVDRTQPRIVRIAAAERSLVFFVMELLRRLQAMATVPAIEYSAYARHVETESRPLD
jgi:hypothetical protein